MIYIVERYFFISNSLIVEEKKKKIWHLLETFFSNLTSLFFPLHGEILRFDRLIIKFE